MRLDRCDTLVAWLQLRQLDELRLKVLGPPDKFSIVTNLVVFSRAAPRIMATRHSRDRLGFFWVIDKLFWVQHVGSEVMTVYSRSAARVDTVKGRVM